MDPGWAVTISKDAESGGSLGKCTIAGMCLVSALCISITSTHQDQPAPRADVNAAPDQSREPNSSMEDQTSDLDLSLSNFPNPK